MSANLFGLTRNARIEYNTVGYFGICRPGKGVLLVAKTRTTTARRRTTKRTSRKKKSNPILFFDILGIALIFLCPVLLLALGSSESSWIRDIAAALRVTMGVGAYIIPFLLALLGVIFIVGPLKIVPRNIGLGSSILFIVAMTWQSLYAGIDMEHPARSGGHIGNLIASALQTIVGDRIGFVVLAASAVIGLIIIINVPLSTVIDRLQIAFQDWVEAARERAERIEAERAKRKPAATKAAAAKEAKIREEKPEDEGRKRTLAQIFAGRNGDGDSGDDESAEQGKVAVLETSRPTVKINTHTALKPEKTSGNGGSQSANDEDEEPVEHGEFQLPPLSLLSDPPPAPPRAESELHENIEIIERTLEEFKVQANVVELAHGPTFTRYEIQLAPGIKVNKIVGLADNLAMQLAAIDVRVEAPIPGKAAIGVEVPNRNPGMVVLKEVVGSKAFSDATSKLVFALGKDVAGKPRVADLAKMPHMLIGGATNAGKSVCLNGLIASLLFRATPDELKMVLIDPKRVELSLFDGIPHLACPVVKEAKLAANVFRAVVQEMEKRYMLLGRVGARNIDGYNEKMPQDEKMPYMVVVVDELCDLMMQAAAEVEASITRIAQLARAVGIHLVIATQRPSVDVITGVIKANISSRIAFAVSSHHDSRTILDQKGAERLVGRGDMLFLPIDASKPTRIQGCYVSEKEIEALCNFLKEQRKPMYTLQVTTAGGASSGSGEPDDASTDEFYEPSVRYVVSTGYCSTSKLQRKFKIGYTRAARIVDTMEQQGIVGPMDGAKPREVLISKDDLADLFGGSTGMQMSAPEQEEDGGFIEEPPPAEIIRPDEEDEDEDEL